MAKIINTEIIIKATPEKVWSILTGFDQYPNWNPFIISLKGEVQIGNQITVSIQPPDGKGMTFKPIVLTRIDNCKLSWRGRLLFRGLFDGEHKFELIHNEDGTTTFIQSERFEGIFVPLLNIENTKKGFEAMNRELKAEVEGAREEFF